MPFFCVYSCILYTEMAKCQFFNKVFGRCAVPLPIFSCFSGLCSFSGRNLKIRLTFDKSPFCGTFALLYCNYTEGRQPLPHPLEKERHTMNESNFVVKTIFHARGSAEVLTENYFATRKEAEEFCALTDYAMKLNYGAEQQLVTTEIVAL